MKYVIGLVAAILIVGVIVVVFSLNKGKTPTVTTTTKSTSTTAQTTAAKTTSGLQITDETVGTGAVATDGKQVTVQYTGTLTNGTVFDSSYSRNQPFPFTLGAGQVIKGWDEGVVGMKVGGKRKLVIPPSLGYGNQAVGSIPANSTLIFEVQLISVQ